jgi:WD40 repeat protein
VANVFVSHSSRDNAIAEDIARWLTEEGFHSVFLDIDTESGIPAGADWERVLYRKIESTQAMILVITPAWHESKWCFVEFAQARALGKAIFPVVVAPGGERYIAPDIQHLDIQIDREGGLGRLAKELTRIALDAQGGFPWIPGRPPYPGLLSFDAEDAAVFFGRDDDVRGLIERLNAQRVHGDIKLLALLGASGAGKSSVLRAGVLPRLKREQRNWTVLRPFRPRRDPVGELARTACEVLEQPETWRQWRDTLVNEPDGFTKLIELVRQREPSGEACILFTIDQGEELFTLSSSDDRERFFELMNQATAQDLPCIVLLALRSDFLGKLQEAAHSQRFAEYSLRPFPHERVRQIIDGPASVAGIRVEDALVDAAIGDMGAEDALPLLAFMLRELYEVCSRSGQSAGAEIELSLAQYRSLGDQQTGLNPLENVVRRRADELIEQMRLSRDDLTALKEAFVGGLTRIVDEGRYARQPARWDILPEASRPVLEEFAKARLVVISEDAGVRTVEVAHEALLRKWPLLRNWLDEEREFLVGRNQLRYAADQWIKSGEMNTALLQGLQLSRARRWLLDHPARFTWVECRLIEASVREDDLKKARVTRLRRWTWASIAVLAALMLIVAFLTREGRVAHADAESASLAVQANLTVAYDPLKAVALAAMAVDRYPSISANSALLQSVLSVPPNLARVWNLGGLHPVALAVDSDTAVIAAVGESGITTWNGFDAKSAALTRESLDRVAAAPGVRSGMLSAEWIGHDLFSVREDGTLVSTDTAGGNVRSVKLSDTVRVTAAAIGRSGRLVLADSIDQSIHFFDCAGALAQSNANCAGRVIGSGYPTALAIDDRRNRVAVGFEDGALQIIALAGAASQPQRPAPLSNKITALAWSPTGDNLAVGTLDGRTVMMDLNGSVQTVSSSQDAVTALAWDDDASQLASAYGSRSICVWRVSGSPRTFSPILARLIGHTDVVRSVAFSRDGQMVVSVADDDTARLWSLRALDPAFAQLPLEMNCVLTALSVSSDNQWLAAGDDHGRAYVWSMKNQSLASSFAALDQQIDSIAWSPDGSRLGLGGDSGSVAIVDRSGNKFPGAPPPWSSPVTGLQWLPDNSGILASGESDGTIHSLLSSGAGDRVFAQIKEGVVLDFTIDPFARELFATDDQGKMWSWNLANGSSSPRAVNTGANRDTIVLSPDARRLVVAGNDGDVLVFERDSSSAPVHCRTGERQLDGAAFSSEGNILAAISSDATLYVWHASSGCDLVAYASLPSLHAGLEHAMHRPRLIALPGLNAFAITDSSSRVLLFPTDPKLWLTRAKEITTLSEPARGEGAETHQQDP